MGYHLEEPTELSEGSRKNEDKEELFNGQTAKL